MSRAGHWTGHWPFLWIAAWIASALAATLLFNDSSHLLARSLDGPTWLHPFGFDTYGRDVLLSALRGSASSMAFAAVASALACLSALLAGSAIAVAPRVAREAGLRTLDALLAFPSLLFALGFAVVRGPGWDTLAFALLIGLIPSLTRLTQARAKEILAEEYVLAARSLGASRARVIVRHVLPAAAELIWLKAPQIFAQALLAEATLSFLGLGAPIGRETWGALLAQSKDYLIEAPHIAIGAGVPLVLTVLAFQRIAREASPGLSRIVEAS